MSCCAGKCGCGSSCSCSNGCGGCGMYPDIEKVASTAFATIIDGVRPKQMYAEGSEPEMSVGTEGGDACKCGSNCTCNPCNC